MLTALEAVLDDYFVVNEQRPATSPAGEMILKVDAVNIFELWGDLREACLKSGVVIPEQVDVSGLPGSVDDFTEAFLASLKFFFDRWAGLPADWRMAGYTRPVDRIAVAYDDLRDQILAELDKRTVSD
jgi:hypothetical protein